MMVVEVVEVLCGNDGSANGDQLYCSLVMVVLMVVEVPDCDDGSDDGGGSANGDDSCSACW